jgi:hypothetical protein
MRRILEDLDPRRQKKTHVSLEDRRNIAPNSKGCKEKCTEIKQTEENLT